MIIPVSTLVAALREAIAAEDDKASGDALIAILECAMRDLRRLADAAEITANIHREKQQ